MSPFNPEFAKRSRAIPINPSGKNINASLEKIGIAPESVPVEHRERMLKRVMRHLAWKKGHETKKRKRQGG